MKASRAIQGASELGGSSGGNSGKQHGAGLASEGLFRGRKVVHLFKHPDGWSEGMFTRRCIREGQPSDIYSIKYDDGTAFDQPCVRTTYGTGLGNTWCIIQPVQS